MGRAGERRRTAPKVKQSREEQVSFTVEGRALHRIHIVGGPGSGKSTLARRLGPSLGAPIYDLDKIAFEGLAFAERPLEARLADVRRIAGEPGWVTEGIFLGWTDDLLRAADAIIWLDHIGWYCASWRIIRRFSSWGIEEARRQPGARKVTRFRDYARNLRQLVDVLVSSRAYYRAPATAAPTRGRRESRSATQQHLQPYWAKVMHCRSPFEIETIAAGMAAKAPRVLDLGGEQAS